MNSVDEFAVRAYAVIAASAAEAKMTGNMNRYHQFIRLMEFAPPEVKLAGAVFAMGAMAQVTGDA